MKLNLIGLDYVTREEAESKNLNVISSDEYYQIYEKNNEITWFNYTFDEKKMVKYPLYINHKFEKNIRNNLAMQEHSRWNSYMLSCGIVPASIDQILNEKVIDNRKYQLKFNKETNGYEIVDRVKRERNSNGKNYYVRRHGNITTFAGLNEFVLMCTRRDNPKLDPNSKEFEDKLFDNDVIKYDYQIMDDLPWFLEKAGYVIIKK